MVGTDFVSMPVEFVALLLVVGALLFLGALVHASGRARREAHRSIADTRAIYSSILRSAMDAIITVDFEGRVVLFNEAAAEMFKTPMDEAVGSKLERFLPDRLRQRHSDYIKQFGSTGVPSRGMGRGGALSGLRADGEEFPIEASISVAETEEGRFFTAIVRDVSERRDLEAQQAVLAREMAHRVKNSFALVQAIASMTHRDTPPDRFYSEFSGRVAAVAQGQDLLFGSSSEAATLESILLRTLSPFKRTEGDAPFSLSGPEVWLSSREVLTLSLAFHELATNAAKYGALSAAPGRIEVSWRVVDESTTCFLELIWKESGGPPVSAPERRGFGSFLIERAVQQDLRGDAKLVFEPQGVEYRFRIPVSDDSLISELARAKALATP